MTTSRTGILSEILGSKVIPPGALAEMEYRLIRRFYHLILKEFIRQERAGKITRAKLATKIGRDRAQISKWLGGETNWTIGTISALLAGLGVEPGPLVLAALSESTTPAVTLDEKEDGLRRARLPLCTAEWTQQKRAGSMKTALQQPLSAASFPWATTFDFSRGTVFTYGSGLDCSLEFIAPASGQQPMEASEYVGHLNWHFESIEEEPVIDAAA